LDELLTIAVLVEGHDGDAGLLADAHLDVDPLVHGQKDRVGERLVEVFFGVDVDAERRF